jgi:hypothetical protein
MAAIFTRVEDALEFQEKEAGEAVVLLIFSESVNHCLRLVFSRRVCRYDFQSDITPVTLLFITGQPHDAEPAIAELVQDGEAASDAVANVDGAKATRVVLLELLRLVADCERHVIWDLSVLRKWCRKLRKAIRGRNEE